MVLFKCLHLVGQTLVLAVAPDAALASVAAAIIMVKGGDFTQKGITFAYSSNSYSSCGCRSFPYYDCSYHFNCTCSRWDKAALEGNFSAIERFTLRTSSSRLAYCCTSCTSCCLCQLRPFKVVLKAMPAWLNEGMQIGGAMVVAVGYASCYPT
ncbi:PTS sugar transporter subunit IIC [Streptococcus equi]|uniref:PTS sugar transporter subunit IIC n=1 Tax=Streptococcus equi TaxID=1336 RepID=UPI003D7E843A